MKQLKSLCKTILHMSLYLYSMCNSHNSFGAAWLQQKGEMQYIFSSLFTMSELDGVLAKNATSISGIYINIYGEVGITNNDTIGLNISCSSNMTFQKDKMKESTFGMPISEFFYRRKIIEIKNFIFSLEGTGKTPAPYQHNDLGDKVFKYSQYPAVEIKANFGVSFYDHMSGIPGARLMEGIFLYGSIAYRHNIGLSFDGLLLELGFGFNVSSFFTVMLSFYKYFSIESIDNHHEIHSYYLGTFLFSVISHINNHISLGTTLQFSVRPEDPHSEILLRQGTGVSLDLMITI